MNAREVMQALLDGQTVESVYGKFKLEPNGEILHFYVNGEEWDVADMIFNDIRAEFKIVEEYPLTFFEAICEMEKGKIVTPESKTYLKYYIDSEGNYKLINESGPQVKALSPYPATFGIEEVESKWKVVE